MGKEWVSWAVVQIHLRLGDEGEAILAPAGPLAAQPAAPAPSPRRCCALRLFRSCASSISAASGARGALCCPEVCRALPQAPVVARDR